MAWLFAVLAVSQGALRAELGAAVLAGAAALVLWRVPLLRHGLASFAAGGLGMVLGSKIDVAAGLGASCHEAGLWSFSTAGMVVACTLGCVAVCRSSGRSGLQPMMHALVLLGMFIGEQTAGALAALAGWVPGHWMMAVAMGAGAALGALTAGLLSQEAQRRSLGRQLADGVAIELSEHG